MSNKLTDRISSYQTATDYKLLTRLPIVICINGRGFARATQLLDKPYDPTFAECLTSTMLRLCNEIEGAVFAYQHNDEIVIVTHNNQNSDTNPWFNNKLQKICSATASVATLHFNECALTKQLNMTGTPIFTSQVFVVPSVGEATNTIIYKQQQNFHTSIQSACLYNLLNKSYDKNNIKDMLTGLNIDEKIDLLSQECGIKYGDYPLSFRRGVAYYKTPQVINGVMKNKWHLNNELPIFTKDQSFLGNLMRMGSDIFRQEGFVDAP